MQGTDAAAGDATVTPSMGATDVLAMDALGVSDWSVAASVWKAAMMPISCSCAYVGNPWIALGKPPEHREARMEMIAKINNNNNKRH